MFLSRLMSCDSWLFMRNVTRIPPFPLLVQVRHRAVLSQQDISDLFIITLVIRFSIIFVNSVYFLRVEMDFRHEPRTLLE